jgi:hypothetical protein
MTPDFRGQFTPFNPDPTKGTCLESCSHRSRKAEHNIGKHEVFSPMVSFLID